MMGQDFEGTIKHNAQLRVVKDNLGFTLEYMNPETIDWIKFTTMMNPEHVLRFCSEIAARIQDQPKLKYEVEGMEPIMRPRPNPHDRFLYEN